MPNGKYQIYLFIFHFILYMLKDVTTLKFYSSGTSRYSKRSGRRRVSVSLQSSHMVEFGEPTLHPATFLIIDFRYSFLLPRAKDITKNKKILYLVVPNSICMIIDVIIPLPFEFYGEKIISKL